VLFTVPFKFGISTPYTTLYSVGGWNFELFSSSIDFQNSNFLGISGVGEITGNGFLPTPATFRFSTQSPSAGGYYSFSASSATPPGSTTIPDGGSTLLLSMIPISAFFAFKKLNSKK
jgi:secreted PhoX family phosphatase